MGTCDSHPNHDWSSERPSRLRVAATGAATRAALSLLRWRGNGCQEGFAILMYHRVAEVVPGTEPLTDNVSPRQLKRQLTGLQARGFECWPLRRLVESHLEGRAVPTNALAVTFDDGYENNYIHAWPILQELGVPATIFLATKYLDTERPFPFDDWPAAGSPGVAVSSWRPLSTRQCQEMLASGMIEIGAHTHSHEKFRGRCQAFRRDLTLCLDILRERFGIDRPPFAFPYGYKSPELVETARQLGVTCCLSTHARRVLPGADEHEWGRIWAAGDDTAEMLAAKICWYSSVTDFGLRLFAKRPRQADNAGARRCGAATGHVPRRRKKSSSS